MVLCICVCVLVTTFYHKLTPFRYRSTQQHGQDEDWVKSQEDVFIKWLNQHLKRAVHVMEVKDLYDDLRDGLVLIELMKTLVPNALKFVR